MYLIQPDITQQSSHNEKIIVHQNMKLPSQNNQLTMAKMGCTLKLFRSYSTVQVRHPNEFKAL